MAVTLLHCSLRLQASCSGIPVWFPRGAALFPYHFPDALYCVFITAEAVSTGPSGYLFWDFYWILNKYVCHWGSLAGFLTYFIEAVLPDKTLSSYFNSNLVSLLSPCTISYMFALAELHLLLFFWCFPHIWGFVCRQSGCFSSVISVQLGSTTKLLWRVAGGREKAWDALQDWETQDLS